MPEQMLLVERRDHALWLTLNRPETLNALNEEMLAMLRDTVNAAGLDPEIGAIVITGAGERAFCAGGDLGDLSVMNRLTVRRLFTRAFEALTAIRRCPQPVIAAINGVAIGAGNELVVACDFAIASPHARLGQAGPRVGSSPVFGGNNGLTLHVGEKRAKEISMLCRLYSASEAAAMGWINAVAPEGGLHEEVDRWVAEILAKSPRYLEISKISANIWWDLMQTGLSHGFGMLMNAAGSDEMLEGIDAFLNRRAPDYNKFRTAST